MESQFTHLFHTNYVPTDEETSQIQADLVSRSRELARIEERLRELTVQRDEMQIYIDAHKRLISYPRRLPLDIVRSIFVACLPTERNAVLSAREAPLILGRICSAWRGIALSTPHLWASLHVPGDFVMAKRELRMPAVAAWLARSGACPISLSLPAEEIPWNSAGPHRADVTAFVKLLAGFADRWGRVELLQVSDAVARGLADIRTPMLRSIIFKSTRVSIFRNLGFLRVPSLRAVTFHPLGPEQLNDFVLDLPLVWDRLTHLNFGSVGFQTQGIILRNVLLVFGRCPRLVSFQFTPLGDGLGEWAESALGPVSVPSLESFVLNEPWLSPPSLARFLERVSMPNLRQLHIASAACSTAAESYFLATLGATTPRLDDLSIALRSFTRNSLLETLRGLPSLTKLTISHTIFAVHGEMGEADDDMEELSTYKKGSTLHTFRIPASGSGSSSSSSELNDPEFVLAALTPPPTVPALDSDSDSLSTDALCPALQELSIKECGSVVKAVIIPFLHRRVEQDTGFRRLRIVFSYDSPTELAGDEMQFFSSRGVDISLVPEYAPVEVPEATPWTGL
ncbi:hypothetical protein B0H11DRAFT_1854726 [Mycena galericulata]|nr:hypothetical protein B0H11DRAFT_1854726 [Mycena galericulata]